jgi:hypothetical protein
VGGDAPGTLALWDETTGTLIAGSLVSIDRVPDLRDVDGKGWPEALAALKATKCIHRVPAFGKIGSCADMPEQGLINFLDTPPQALQAVRTMAPSRGSCGEH